MLITDTMKTSKRLHADQLADEVIDGLVFEHIFKQSRLCTGRTEPGMRPGTRRCTECEALLDETMAMRLFEEKSSHPRPIPGYTKNIGVAWSIIDALRGYSDATMACFALFLDALIYEERTRQRPRSLVGCTKQHFVFGTRPRLIAIAALQAIDVFDINGYLKEGEDIP
jgi:hypothetical protein